MAFKTSQMDQIALEYWYYGFLGRLRVDGRGFLHQTPILKNCSPEQKSSCRTCAEACHSPFKWSPYWLLILVNSGFRNINLAANIPFLFLFRSLRKILKTFIRFLPSSFNRKYVYMVACTVVFVGPSHFVFNDYPGRNATCPLSSCSNKNDGPRGRFDCVFLPFLVKDPFV